METYKDLGFGIIQTTKEPSYKQGWECPKCRAIMSPTQPFCIFCQPKNIQNIQATYTGITQPIQTENKSISKGE